MLKNLIIKIKKINQKIFKYFDDEYKKLKRKILSITKNDIKNVIVEQLCLMYIAFWLFIFMNFYFEDTVRLLSFYFNYLIYLINVLLKNLYIFLYNIYIFLYNILIFIYILLLYIFVFLYNMLIFLYIILKEVYIYCIETLIKIIEFLKNIFK